MQFLFQNSAHALWVLWATTWHTFWLLGLTIFIVALIKSLKNKKEDQIFKFEFRSLLLEKLKNETKEKIYLLPAFIVIWWYFFGLGRLVLFLFLAALFFIFEVAFFAIKERKVHQINYQFDIHPPQKKNITSALRKLSSLDFWQKQATIELKTWAKTRRAYIFSIILISTLGGILSYGFWTKAIQPSVSLIDLPYNTTIALVLGAFLPVLLITKLPLAAILYRAGLPFGVLSVYFLGSFVIAWIREVYKKDNIKTTILFAAYTILGLFLTALAGHLLYTFVGLQNFKAAEFLQQKIRINYVFWANAVTFVLLIKAFFIREKELIFPFHN